MRLVHHDVVVHGTVTAPCVPSLCHAPTLHRTHEKRVSGVSMQAGGGGGCGRWRRRVDWTTDWTERAQCGV